MPSSLSSRTYISPHQLAIFPYFPLLTIALNTTFLITFLCIHPFTSLYMRLLTSYQYNLSRIPCALQVAVKTLSGDARCVSAVLVTNLAREAALLCNLRHPNILTVFGVVKGADGSTVSIVCALAVNGSLENALRGVGIAGPPNPVAARQIAIGIARGIAYLHSLDPAVAHNDLKSGNVLLSQNGTAMLADFGLARIVETSTIANFGPKSRKTDAGAVGTAAWMAPENGTLLLTFCLTFHVHTHSIYAPHIPHSPYGRGLAGVMVTEGVE